MIKSNPDLLSKPSLFYVVLLSLLILHLKSKSVILMSLIFSYEFLSSCDIEFVPADSISLVDFRFSSEVDLIDYKPSSLGPI